MTPTPNVAGDTSSGPSVLEDSYYFAAAATAGDACMIDVGTTATSTGNTLNPGEAAKKTTATADLASCIGGLVTTVTAGSWGNVRRSGVQTGVNVKSTVSAGDALRTSTDAAGGGRLETAANTDVNIVGYALTAASSNTSTVLWKTL